MHQIDINLHDAWQRVVAKCRRDPVEAYRRALRQFQAMVNRPLRQACLCLRAADRRITSYNTVLELLPGAHVPRDFDIDELASRQTHWVTLTGTLVRQLTKPVHVPFPGEDWTDIADKCGCKPSQLYTWARAGTLIVQDYMNAREIKKRGKRVPIMYAPRAIDPNNFNGRAPDPMWGNLWEWMWEDFPESFEQRVMREPRYRVKDGRRVFRGFEWICPGRWEVVPEGFEAMLGGGDDDAEACEEGDGNDEVGRFTHPLAPSLEGGGNGPEFRVKDGVRLMRVPCGRRCHYLYGPMPVWTLGKALGFGGGSGANEFGLPMPGRCGGNWAPGLGEATPGTGWRTFACKKCWNVHSPNLTDRHGWNEFVTLISGGLLYGGDVERPADEAPARYKREGWRRRAAERRGVANL